MILGAPQKYLVILDTEDPGPGLPSTRRVLDLDRSSDLQRADELDSGCFPDRHSEYGQRQRLDLTDHLAAGFGAGDLIIVPLQTVQLMAQLEEIKLARNTVDQAFEQAEARQTLVLKGGSEDEQSENSEAAKIWAKEATRRLSRVREPANLPMEMRTCDTHLATAITPGVGVGDPAQEIDKLDVGVFWVEGVRAEFSGEDLQCGEQNGGAVALVVVGLLLRVRRGQRLVLAGAGQGLDLGLLI